MKKLLFIFLITSTATAFCMELDLSEVPAGPHEDYLTACLNGKTDKIMRLLKEYPNLSRTTDKDEKTGLILAAGNGHHKTVARMLSFHSKEDVAITSQIPQSQQKISNNIEKGTALWWAYYHDRMECINLLEQEK